MGQKINPTGFRIGVIQNWESRWYANTKDFGDLLVEDYKLREYLLKLLKPAGVPKIEIERTPQRVNITIHCAKPGLVIGRQGADIEKLKAICAKRLGGKAVNLNIVEIRQPDLNATLVAESIAGALERRVSFRRCLKQAIGRTMKLGAKGIKTQVGGRLGGAEIARSEHYHEGTIPLQTLRADIDYGFAEAHTTYGVIGVKVWIYHGEVLNAKNALAPRTYDEPRRRDRGDRRDRRPRDGQNRGGNDRGGFRGGDRRPQGGAR
ncbi:MAG: 30S ribosomal protein S3 [Oscillospiraceae bacterium]|jgi:small subunit ribosomal protein S3|nr:30S ribosomal protein S3 [Oscillospiraceae bacterium]